MSQPELDPELYCDDYEGPYDPFCVPQPPPPKRYHFRFKLPLTKRDAQTLFKLLNFLSSYPLMHPNKAEVTIDKEIVVVVDLDKQSWWFEAPMKITLRQLEELVEFAKELEVDWEEFEERLRRFKEKMRR